MAKRNQVSLDLLFGLVALERGLVDRDQLVAAFQIWSEKADRTIAEVLLAQGAIDQSGRALLERVVRNRISLRERDPAERERSYATGHRDRHRADEQDLPGTLTYRGASSPDGISDDPQRSTAPAAGPSNASPSAERYPIVRPYARGGLGEVFLALDPELDRQVALKELRAYHAHDPVSQSRFVLEAKVTGRLEHPGIVPVYGLGRYADGRPYYAMRFIEGETLKQAIDRFYSGEGARASRASGRSRSAACCKA